MDEAGENPLPTWSSPEAVVVWSRLTRRMFGWPIFWIQVVPT